MKPFLRRITVSQFSDFYGKWPSILMWNVRWCFGWKYVRSSVQSILAQTTICKTRAWAGQVGQTLSMILSYNLESISEISVWHIKNTISLRTPTLSLDMSRKFCLKQNEPYCYTFTLFHLIFMYLILVLLCTVLDVYWNYHKAIRNWYVEGKIDIQVDVPNEKRSTVDLTSKKKLLILITPTGWHPYKKEFAPTVEQILSCKSIIRDS